MTEFALVFSLVVGLVAVLRPPCRRFFGSERTYLAWLVVPLSLGVACLPHAADAPTIVMRMPAWPAMPVTTLRPLAAHGANGMPWLVATVWLAGAMAWLAIVAVAQWRFARRIRGARRLHDAPRGLAVWVASDADIGPALVGTVHPRIVLPADFHDRFDASEQALILAHESIHASRHDGRWMFVAHLMAAAFWFHPLGWWALRAFRFDQELACDAAVMRLHPAQRRSYAFAMTKSHGTAFLPIGCRWSPRHPLTERIAMLKLPAPTSRRRLVSAIVLPAILGGAMSAAYAMSPASTNASMIQIQATFDTRGVADKPIVICMAPGTSGTIRNVDMGDRDAWEFMFTPTLAGSGKVWVDIDTSIDLPHERKTSHERLLGDVGEELPVAQPKGVDGGLRKILIKPTLGCAAATAKDPGRVVQVSATVDKGTARATAIAIAGRAGLTLDNPEALDENTVGLGFDRVEAHAAIRLIADIDGRKASFDGTTVHFSPK